MSEFRVASRYAKSLLDLAKENGQLDQVKNDMLYFSEVCENNRDFILLLKNPIIPSDKKLKIIYQIFAHRVNPLTLSIFDITIRKRREDILYSLSQEFVSQYNKLNHIQIAQVITATSISGDLLARVEYLASNIANGRVTLKNIIDPKILGGFILRIGDVQLDESVLSQLKKLKSSFRTNPFESKL